MRLTERLTKLEATRTGRSLSSLSDAELEAALLDVSRRILRNPIHDPETRQLAQSQIDRLCGQPPDATAPTGVS